jgi:two-component system response regulator QseB
MTPELAAVYDAVVLDLGLPDGAGIELVKSARARGVGTPILIATARDRIADRIAGLDAGADDYMIKPIDLDELAARLRALERRASGRAAPLIELGRITIDPAARKVTRNGMPIKLTAREFALLLALARRPGAVLTRAQLAEALYGWNESVESNAVDVHVHHLRRKLGAALIETQRGLGYRLVVPS